MRSLTIATNCRICLRKKTHHTAAPIGQFSVTIELSLFRNKLMATATVATAAGAVVLQLNCKLQTNASNDDGDDENGVVATSHTPLGIDRVSRLIQAPATWLETISTLSATLRFTYAETLGKWPMGDLTFGINFLLKRQGNLHVDSIFGGEDIVRLQGPQIIAEFRSL